MAVDVFYSRVLNTRLLTNTLSHIYLKRSYNSSVAVFLQMQL